MKWIGNCINPELADYAEAHQVIRYLKSGKYKIGEPRATERLTTEVLKMSGIVGVYAEE